MIQYEVCYIKALFKDWGGYGRARTVFGSAYGVAVLEFRILQPPRAGWI